MKKFGFKMILAGVVLLVVMPVMNQAAAVISTFDSDLEGWTGSGAALSWSTTEGNPSGSLSSSDNADDWAQVIAPAKFLGPWQSTGTVSADIKGGSGEFPAFVISDGNTSYEYVFSTKADQSSWQNFSASLSDSGWKLIQTGNQNWYYWSPPIGTETLATVLQNVTDFHIRTDLAGGLDRVYLDNINAPTAVPLPPSVWLLGSGLLGLLGFRRFRKS